MCAAFGGHIHFQKLKNLLLFENLNDAYIIWMLNMFATQLVKIVHEKS